MNRRQALRAAAAVGASLSAAGCATHRSTAGQRRPIATSTAGVTDLTRDDELGRDPGATLPPEVVHGPRDRPAVALTFHGQGDPTVVTQLLSRLEARDVRVTVLAVGSWLAAAAGDGPSESSTAATNWATTRSTTSTSRGWTTHRRSRRSTNARRRSEG